MNRVEDTVAEGRWREYLIMPKGGRRAPVQIDKLLAALEHEIPQVQVLSVDIPAKTAVIKFDAEHENSIRARLGESFYLEPNSPLKMI
jgi:hypothetical protein